MWAPATGSLYLFSYPGYHHNLQSENRSASCFYVVLRMRSFKVALFLPMILNEEKILLKSCVRLPAYVWLLPFKVCYMRCPCEAGRSDTGPRGDLQSFGVAHWGQAGCHRTSQMAPGTCAWAAVVSPCYVQQLQELLSKQLQKASDHLPDHQMTSFFSKYIMHFFFRAPVVVPSSPSNHNFYACYCI